MKWYWDYSRFYWVDIWISGLTSLGIILSGTYFHFEFDPTEVSYSTLAAVAGALLGFLIAALTVMVGLLREEGMELMRRSGHSTTILRIFHSTIVFLSITTLAAMIPLFSKDIGHENSFIGCVLFLLFASAFRLQKCVWVLMKVLHVV